jgi:hypothetical protein
MTLSANITKLAAIGANITGIKKSFDVDAMPSSLQPVMLPAMMYYPDGGSITLLDFSDTWEVKHRVRVQFAYSAAAQGILSKNIDGTVDLLDRFLAALRTDNDLTGSCVSAKAVNYSRIGDFTYGGVDYFGIEVTVEVLEYLG